MTVVKSWLNMMTVVKYDDPITMSPINSFVQPKFATKIHANIPTVKNTKIA